MTIYECKRCGYSTNIQTNYSKHINIKRICKSKYSDADRSLLAQELEEYKKKNLKGGIISKIRSNTLENTLEYAGNENDPIVCTKCNTIIIQNSVKLFKCDWNFMSINMI